MSEEPKKENNDEPKWYEQLIGTFILLFLVYKFLIPSVTKEPFNKALTEVKDKFLSPFTTVFELELAKVMSTPSHSSDSIREAIDDLVKKTGKVNYQLDDGTTILIALAKVKDAYIPKKASIMKYKQFLVKLIQKGININARDNENRTALIWIMLRPPKSLVTGEYAEFHEFSYYLAETLLLKEAAVNYVDKYGFTALMYACQNGHRKYVSLLLRKGANAYVVSPNGDTAERLASSPEIKSMLRLHSNRSNKLFR